MRIPRFELDHWLAKYEFASPPIRYNLASSTGPTWTLSDLLALGDTAGVKELGDLRLSYAPPQGSEALDHIERVFRAIEFKMNLRHVDPGRSFA